MSSIVDEIAKWEGTDSLEGSLEKLSITGGENFEGASGFELVDHLHAFLRNRDPQFGRIVANETDRDFSLFDEVPHPGRETRRGNLT